MPKNDELASDRVADVLERIADTLESLLTAWQEREKKFAERAAKPRGSFGDKRSFGDRGGFKKRFDDDGGDRPFKKRFDRDSDDSDFKKRGPRSTFRDFDAPKNRGPKKFGDKKPGGFKGKKKF